MAEAKKTTARKRTSSPKKAPSRAKKTTAKRNTVKPVEQPVDQPAEPLRLAVRNTTHLQTSFRLERQMDRGKRRTELKPRGQRGDFALLQPGDEHDQNLQDQLNAGIVELITQDEAAAIAKKQTTNQQHVHPALAMLRNERGEPYEDGAFQVAPSFEEQGVVVAQLQDGQVAFDRGGIVRSGEAAGQNAAGPRGAQRLRQPGAAPNASPYTTQAPIPAPPGRESDAAADAKARRKDVQGPSAGLPTGMQVTVAPTQHT